MIDRDLPEEVGRAELNVATPTYATVAYKCTVGLIHKQNW